MLDGIETKAINTHLLQPEASDILHLHSHFLVVVVGVRHSAPKDSVVVLAVHQVPDTLSPGSGIATVRPSPDMSITVSGVRPTSSIEKPGVSTRCVIQDQIDDDSDTPSVRLHQKSAKRLPISVV